MFTAAVTVIYSADTSSAFEDVPAGTAVDGRRVRGGG